MTNVESANRVSEPDWRARMANVANPRLLYGVVGLTFLVGLAAVFALLSLGQTLKTQPRTIRAQADVLAQTLTLADWASSGGNGPVVYVIGFPTCPDCVVFKRQELKKFLDAGIDVRAVEFAPRRADGTSSAEEAKAAAVARSRAFEDYLAPTEAYPLSTTGDLEYVERGRATIDAIESVLKANRTSIAFPLFVWQRPGGDTQTWRYLTGSNPTSTQNILREVR